MTSLAEASWAREQLLAFEELDRRIDLLFEDLHGPRTPDPHFARVTANPRSMGYLRFLLRYYAKAPHPWTKCVADNTKRFGPERVKALCGVLKDTIRQQTMWRHGPPRGPHAGHPDSGSPGVAIGEADKWASPAWGGHKLAETRTPSLLDEFDMEFGVVDHTEYFDAAVEALCELGQRCDIFRVLIGLDAPPVLTLKEAA